MAAKDIEAHQFKPGQSGNPKGRPKSRVPEQLVKIFGSKARAKKFYSLSSVEIDEWEAAILSFSANDLKLLAKWDAAPAYPKGLAIAVLSDMKNGKTTTLDKLRERQYGKPTQRMELTGKDGGDLIPARTLTKEEAADLLQSLNEKY
ncbi:DUF5681 domain-containing protein [Bacteroides fragilis]